MIVPSPYGLTGDAYMRSLIDSGFLGQLREVHVHSFNDQLADPETPLSWRQLTRYSGFNMLTSGNSLRDGAALGRAGEACVGVCDEDHSAAS